VSSMTLREFIEQYYDIKPQPWQLQAMESIIAWDKPFSFDGQWIEQRNAAKRHFYERLRRLESEQDAFITQHQNILHRHMPEAQDDQ